VPSRSATPQSSTPAPAEGAAGAPGPFPAPTHLLYLHGFRSSPQSFKARRLQAWLAAHRPDVHWWCPQLPPSPREALALLLHGVAGWPAGHSAVLGSSLGGCYAAVLTHRLAWPAVLLNPAVDPARDLARHIGEQSIWQHPEEHFFFRPEFVDELRAMQVERLAWPERCLAVIAQGDEVLDWREMAALCSGARLKLLQGGDHALSDFDHHLPDILGFLHLQDPQHLQWPQHPA
jgi:hypothetical protein